MLLLRVISVIHPAVSADANQFIFPTVVTQAYLDFVRAVEDLYNNTVF